MSGTVTRTNLQLDQAEFVEPSHTLVREPLAQQISSTVGEAHKVGMTEKSVKDRDADGSTKNSVEKEKMMIPTEIRESSFLMIPAEVQDQGCAVAQP